jgi:hypothetical protein
MDERLRFVARLLDGEKMAVRCREFGSSRKTGDKIAGKVRYALPAAVVITDATGYQFGAFCS